MPVRSVRPVVAAALALLAAAPAAAGSQSSNSSSNCSNGRSTRVETFDAERGGFRRGWTRVERWDERPPMWRGHDRSRHYGAPHPHHARPCRGGSRDD